MDYELLDSLQVNKAKKIKSEKLKIILPEGDLTASIFNFSSFQFPELGSS